MEKQLINKYKDRRLPRRFVRPQLCGLIPSRHFWRQTIKIPFDAITHPSLGFLAVCAALAGSVTYTVY